MLFSTDSVERSCHISQALELGANYSLASRDRLASFCSSSCRRRDVCTVSETRPDGLVRVRIPQHAPQHFRSPRRAPLTAPGRDCCSCSSWPIQSQFVERQRDGEMRREVDAGGALEALGQTLPRRGCHACSSRGRSLGRDADETPGNQVPLLSRAGSTPAVGVSITWRGAESNKFRVSVVAATMPTHVVLLRIQ